MMLIFVCLFVLSPGIPLSQWQLGGCGAERTKEALGLGSFFFGVGEGGL